MRQAERIVYKAIVENPKADSDYRELVRESFRDASRIGHKRRPNRDRLHAMSDERFRQAYGK